MRVGLFITCVNDALYPGTGQAVVSLLERLGVEVGFPAGQTCCGQMHFNTGYRSACTPMAEGFAKSFSGYDAVVTPSASCAGMIRHHHPVVARSNEVTGKTYELSEFLVDVLGVTDVGAYYPHRVTYHPTCHSLRMLGVGDRPLTLLRAVRGLELVELPAAEQCCGFGGTFALKNSDVSVAMGADKVSHVRETGAEVLTAADNSCLMHLGGMLGRLRTGVRPVHLAEILASTEDAA